MTKHIKYTQQKNTTDKIKLKYSKNQKENLDGEIKIGTCKIKEKPYLINPFEVEAWEIDFYPIKKIIRFSLQLNKKTISYPTKDGQEKAFKKINKFKYKKYINSNPIPCIDDIVK